MNRLKNKTDNELVYLFLKTNKTKFFGEIYNRHIDSVFYYVLNHTKDRETAEDITSETFSILLKNLHKFNETSKLKTFIIGIAKNKIMQHWDKVKKENRSDFIEDVHSSIPNFQDEVFDEKETREQDNVVTQIDKVLESLDERDRFVLTEKFLRGSDSNDIAEKLGVTLGNLRIIQFRALKKAQKFLKNL